MSPKEHQQGVKPLVIKKKIKVKAILHCSNCGYNKAFKNEFTRENLEMLVVSAKVMSWTTCECGEMVDLELIFEI
ncbi:MAG: hypothetical protein ACTSVI_10010 [Promethearchaeota archaeon]